MLSNFRPRRIALIIAVFIVLVAIVILSGIALYLNSSKPTVDPLAKEYSELNDKILKATSDNALKLNTDIQVAKENLSKLPDSKLTKKQKYDLLANSTFRLSSAYSATNVPALRPIINTDLNNFAKKNFPEYYEGLQFYASCQDESCRTSARPPELDTITNKIQSSDFPKDVKDTLIEDLNNTALKSDEKKDGKPDQYMMLASMVEENNWFSPAGQNKEIAQDIYELVKKYYPNDYEDILETINVSKEHQN